MEMKTGGSRDTHHFDERELAEFVRICAVSIVYRMLGEFAECRDKVAP